MPMADERPALIATGALVRARERARQEVAEERTSSSSNERSSQRAGVVVSPSPPVVPRQPQGPHVKRGYERRLSGGLPPNNNDVDEIFALSPKYSDVDTLETLRLRRPIDLCVRNRDTHDSSDMKSAKQDESLTPSRTDAQKTKRRQPWFPPVRVPLAHRKLVESPRIFDPLLPSHQRIPAEATARPNVQQRTVSNDSSSQKISRDHAAERKRKRERVVNREFLDKLRACNQVLYDRLCQRFRGMDRVDETNDPSVTNLNNGSSKAGWRRESDANDGNLVAGISRVEDAVLFFMHEKHSHDLLYFRRRGSVPGEGEHRIGAQVSLTISSSASTKLDSSARYMPYDLEHMPAGPDSGTNDFFIMSSTSLVHHSSENDGQVSGEVIPIAQWVMESKMFSLLLAGIPLFQKFLVRKVFVCWLQEVRRLIFDDLRRRINSSLPLARASFVAPILSSVHSLRKFQDIHALALPSRRASAVTLSALCDYHRELLSEAETKLIDAKEDLLLSMDTMVQEIQLKLDPSTHLDELYNVESSAIHTANPKWKSVPIVALRYRKESMARQVQTAKIDMTLLETYVRLMEYMFSESVYLMVLSCVQYLTSELESEENAGIVSASVAIVQDELVLSPSLHELKEILLESVARLIRLVGNFHFTKNAMSWSSNRGTGALSIIASSFTSSVVTEQFDLQHVLRTDDDFKAVTARLVQVVIDCFEEAAHQMKAFESLKPIYAAVQSVSRSETRKDLRESTRVDDKAAADLATVIGVSGTELGRYLKFLAHRLAVLDRSQHACQKIQSSWKVGFLEIQCRRSITEILDLITEERDMLHQHLLSLAVQGSNECLSAIQKASLILEDRPQLIEYFCEQLKLVKIMKENDKQLHQDVRNVDEIIRALKRYAPELLADHSVQYNLLHTVFGKYGQLAQAHDKFVAKMLPNITQQVSTALQKHIVRCQRLLRLYEEHADTATEEELEKNVVMFQDVSREIRTIGDATQLYQEYQRMVGMKVTEISSLGEAKQRWQEVQDVIALTLDWKTTVKIMENGIFSEQPWPSHRDRVASFTPRIQELQAGSKRVFAAKLVGKLMLAASDLTRRLELVIDMAQPFMKPHHWQQIFALLDIVNYVSSSGVVLSDGSTLTLGFLQSRNLWKHEGSVREIIIKARHDAATESKIEEMRRRLYAATVPIVKTEDSYELDAAAATGLLIQFEHDLISVQTLAQLTTSIPLSSSLAQWAEEISSYQEVLASWLSVQADYKRLALVFSHHDVQQCVVDATYEFQALDRKWKAMMNAVKGSSSLAVCLREVMNRAFLNTCSQASEKLWNELGHYLWEKRQSFGRLNFLSDRDLLHIIASTRYPARLGRLITKCFREIQALKMIRVDTAARIHLTRHPSSSDIGQLSHIDLETDSRSQVFDIEGVCGVVETGDTLLLKPLRVNSSPEIWMKDLCIRIRDSMRDAIAGIIDSPFVPSYESDFADILKQQVLADTSDGNAISHWSNFPVQAVLVCASILLTNDLTSRVCEARAGSNWSSFWQGFVMKKQNLVNYVRRRDLSKRERFVATALLILLINREPGIQELFREEPVSTGAQSQSQQQDTTSIQYNYANGSSFAWTKLMRYYYDPFDKKCVIHQSIRSYEYGNSFISTESRAVLTPVCERTILALNVALSTEVGALIHSSPAYNTGKRTLLRELATAIGIELIDFDCSITPKYSILQRALLGALQTDSCWVALSGLESHTSFTCIHALANSVSRIRDAVHGGQDVCTLDGIAVDVTNRRLGIFVCSRLRQSEPVHQELMLRLTYGLMPVACSRPSDERIAEVLLLVAGFKESSRLSRSLGVLLKLLANAPTPRLSSPVSIRQVTKVLRSTTKRHANGPWKSEEKCLVLSLWDELSCCVLPDERLTVAKLVKSLFPSAENLHLSPLGLLASKIMRVNDGGSSREAGGTEELIYDSDDESRRDELSRVRERARLYLETHRYCTVSDLVLRKVLDIYRVLQKHTVVVLLGPSGCGKTTALDTASTLINCGEGNELSSLIKVARLFPSAFSLSEIYGQFTEDGGWSDGFFTKFFKTQCEDSVPGRSLSTSSGGPSQQTEVKASLSTSPWHPGTVASWLVFDGADLRSIIEPLRELAAVEPHQIKRWLAPNGDQHHCDNPLLRIVFETTSVDAWSPASLSRCGVVFLAQDGLTYTMLIKSWISKNCQLKPKHAALVTALGKHARNVLPGLLELCKRHTRSFMETLILHQVSNMLEILNVFVESLPPDGSNDSRAIDARVVLAYGLMLALGLSIGEKGRFEFHQALISAIPEIVEAAGEVLAVGDRTVFDLCLRFEGEATRLTSFANEVPTDGGLVEWMPGSVRRGAIRRNSEGPSGGSSSLSASAKRSVLIIGESGVGKSRLLEDVSATMEKTERFDTRHLSVDEHTRSVSVLQLIETGLPRKMRGLYCPVAGKKALIVVVENLHLEVEHQTSHPTSRSATEVLRQVCDSKGSFVGTSKEFVEFRDVVFGATFSLSPFGYPRLLSRFLRHVHPIWFPDPSRDVCQSLLSSYSAELVSRLPIEESTIQRICRLPVEIFFSIRKHLKPAPFAPYLLLSLNDVLLTLSRIVTGSGRKMDTARDFEIFVLHSTYFLYRNRAMTKHELARIEEIHCDVAAKLEFSGASLDVIRNSHEYMFVDFGESDGCVRLTSRAAQSLVASADERFQWYHRPNAHDSAVDSNASSGVGNQGMPAATVPPSPMRGGVEATSPASPRPGDMAEVGNPTNTEDMVNPASGDDQGSEPDSRRSSLVMAAVKSSHTEKSAATTPAAIQDMLDVHAFLQSSHRQLLLHGGEASNRRCATMLACGAHAFHFREVTSHPLLQDFIDQIKAPILETGVKATHMLLYFDCDVLAEDERGILMHLMEHHDLPHHLYTSADKAKILAFEHQLRVFQHSHTRRPSISSFFDDLTTVTSTRDGMLPLRDVSDAGRQNVSSSAVSPRKRSVYRDNLKRCLFVALSFGSSTAFFRHVQNHPSLYYRAAVKTFRPMSADSLEAIYNECLGSLSSLNDVLARASVSKDARHDLRSLMVAIHQDIQTHRQPPSGNMASRPGATRSQFEEFLRLFKVFFLFQRKKTAESVKALQNALRLLDSDRHTASEQLEKSAGNELLLEDAAKAVVKSSERLREYETAERDAKRSFLLDEQRCSALQVEIEEERDQIQKELNQILPDVAKATDALSQINKYHITEMKSFVNPPQLVRLAMQAVCVLLGAPPTWTEALRILADIHFLDRLRNFDKDRVDISLIERVKLYVNHPDFSMENMKRASIASTTLCKWVLSIVRYFEVMRRVAPTQKKLAETERQFQLIDDMVRAERQKLVDLELKLNELRVEHARNLQRELEWQRNHDGKMRWKTEVQRYADVVMEWTEVLTHELNVVKTQQFRLVGDCAIFAAMLAYTSDMSYQDRTRAVQRWQDLAGRHLNGRPTRTSAAVASTSGPEPDAFLQRWHISGRMLKADIQRVIMGRRINQQQVLAVNLVLMDQVGKVCFKYPLLVDPLGTVSNWIKKRGTLTVADTTVGPTESTRASRDAVEVASTSLQSADSEQTKPVTIINRQASAVGAAHFIVVVADAADPNIVAAIEKRITVKTPQLILIENVADCLETQFHTLLDLAALAKKKGGHNVVFSTRTLGDMPAWRPKVWGQLSVINCTPDEAEIEDHLTTLLIHRFASTLEKDLDAVCKGYATEKAKVRQVMQSFVDFLQTVQSDREVNASLAPEGIGVEESALQEHEMGRISRFLDEFVAAREKFTNVKTRWDRLRGHRDDYRKIAQSCATFCSAEHLMKNCMKHLELSWPVSTVLQKIEDAVKVESSARRASVTPSLDITNAAMADAATLRITHHFVSGRLLALPVWLHRPYKFAVAFIAAQAKGDIDATAFESLIVKEFTSTKGVSRRQRHRRSSTHESGVTQPIRQIATQFVFASINAALRSVSGCAGHSENLLSDELVALRDCIEVGFLSVMAKNRDASPRVSVLRTSLYRDLAQHPEVWQDYMHDPTIGIEKGDDGLLEADHETKDSLLPEWIRQLTVMERLCLHVSVFGLPNAVAQVDATIQHYLGLSHSCFKTRSLEYVVNHTASHTPVMIHHQSAVQVSVPSSQLLALARTLGIRDDMIASISLPATDTVNERTREISGLKAIKESAVSGGWIIIQHVERASASTANTIRHQLQSLQEMGSSPHVDYRLWLLRDAIPQRHHASRSLEQPLHRRNPYLSDVSTHFFNEHPQSLQEHYEAHRLEDRLRREHLDKLHTLQQQQQGLPSSHQSTRRALELTKRQSSSVPLTAASAPVSEQLAIQVALWLFHSITQRFVGAVSPFDRRSLPNDIIVSQFELERAYHAIQLHQRLRMVASTMTSVAGISSPTQALSPMNEWRSMYELASAVYSNRLGHAHFVGLCHELLATCLAPTSQNGSTDHGTTSNRPSPWQSQLSTVKELFSQHDSGMSLFTEHDLIPESLHRWILKNVCEAALRVGVVEAPATQYTANELVAIAQRIAKQLMAQLPPKSGLSVGVEHQEHQRRASAILTWRKNRTARGVDEASTSAERRFEAIPRWNVALSEHLLQTELPAMEKHLRHVWDITEMVVALKADPFASIATNSSSFQDFATLLEAISCRQVPQSWRSGNGVGSTMTTQIAGSAGYTSPSRLKPWVKWLHRAVIFYQRLFSSCQTPRLPDVLWLPALRYPTACFFSLRCSVAVERDLHVDDLIFVIESRDAATERNGGSRSNSVALASFAVSGLVLWNASWSTELHALEETVTRRRRPRDVLSLDSYRDDTATPVATAFTEALPVFEVSLVHRPQQQQQQQQQEPPSSTTQFSCPVFRSFRSKQRFEDPVVYLVTPTVDRASTFVACDVAMFLTDDMDA